MPRLRPAPKEKPSVDKLDASESMSGLFENKQETPEVELHENEAPEEEVQVAAAGSGGEPPKEEDATLALQKQLEDLKKSEEHLRNQAAQAAKDRDEAIRRAQERDIEVSKFQKEATQSQYDSITSALAAAQAEAERAAQDVEIAGTNSDFKALADAQRRLARAESRIDKLEDGKFELESRVKAERAAPKPEPKQQVKSTDPLENSGLPDTAKTWLRGHPEYLTDARKNARITSLHHEAMAAGHKEFTQPYFEYIEEQEGLREKPQQQEQQAQQTVQQQRTNIVSAPVSREVPSSGNGSRQNGKINLNKDQKEAARIAGITEVEYAKQLIKLEEMRASGQYSESR